MARPWGQKVRGLPGHVLSWDALEKALKMGDAFQVGDVVVGAATLLKLVRLMREDDTDVHVCANGRLELTLRDRKRVVRDGKPRIASIKAKRQRMLALVNRAWLRAKAPQTVVVLRPSAN